MKRISTMLNVTSNPAAVDAADAFTHGGINFHCDEVLASAVLFLNAQVAGAEQFTILRGFSVPKDTTAVVFDIGGGKYDHHQEGKEKREDGVPYAAAGLIWRDFYSALCDGRTARHIDRVLFRAVDAHDNGELLPEVKEGEYTFSRIIAGFNKNWEEAPRMTDERFRQAVLFAADYLSTLISVTEKGTGHFLDGDPVEEVMVRVLAGIAGNPTDIPQNMWSTDYFSKVADLFCTCEAVKEKVRRAVVSLTLSNHTFVWMAETIYAEDGDWNRVEEYLHIIVTNTFASAESCAKAIKIVRKAFTHPLTQEGILFLEDGFVPWKEHVFAVEREMGIEGVIKFAVFNSPRGVNAVVCPVEGGGQFSARIAPPAEWWAKEDSELQELCGVAGANFCHKSNGFLTSCSTVADAVTFARKCISLASEESEESEDYSVISWVVDSEGEDMADVIISHLLKVPAINKADDCARRLCRNFLMDADIAYGVPTKRGGVYAVRVLHPYGDVQYEVVSTSLL